MLKYVWAYFIVINICGVYIMYNDKRRARHKKFRIREATLWRVAVIGGAIGTSLGMYWFRHKTKHMAFKLGFPILAVIDIVLLLLVTFHF